MTEHIREREAQEPARVVQGVAEQINELRTDQNQNQNQKPLLTSHQEKIRDLLCSPKKKRC